MSVELPITDDLVEACLRCPRKAYLRLTGVPGQPSAYVALQRTLDEEHRAAARAAWLRRRPLATVAADPPSIAAAGGAQVITGLTVSDAGEACRFDALERIDDRPGAAPRYAPVAFVRPNRVTVVDRLRLAFGAGVLARVQRTRPATGRIVHGPKFIPLKVDPGRLTRRARAAAAAVKALADHPPPVVLNRHCPECEYRDRCRADAEARDDLSLLQGLSPLDIEHQNKKGIFTVAQLSYTFRPGRFRMLNQHGSRRHDPALQALAVREDTVYVARPPELPAAATEVYLDVEGLTDPDRYYLIGLLVVRGDTCRHHSFWANGPAHEPAMWRSFLRLVAGLGDDLAVFHYGSYETRFLKRMAARHGGDPLLLGRVKDRAVNVLGAIQCRVFFPTHGNGLKAVAGRLGFRWAAADPSGLQAVVWRHRWEAARDAAAKQALLDYNRDDCAALRRVVEFLRGLGGAGPRSEADPKVAAVDAVRGACVHKFGDPDFVVPEFNRIVRCAYFDYQRDKVLFRTNPAVRKAVRRIRQPAPRCKVDREATVPRPESCPQCGSSNLHVRGHHQRTTVELKPVRGGLKRWVTRHQGKSYQCRRCGHVMLPWVCTPGRHQKYGWTICAWVAYATVALRVTTEAAADVLRDLFGIPLQRAEVPRYRGFAADRYRGTYESILAGLRAGPVVHADETWAPTKRPAQRGYVWVFANPTAAAYVYSPSRDGDTVRDALAGFRGVLVSDFYGGYEGIDCPQQKCLVHLARDLNDELVKNPFDDDLKGLAGGFSALMQAVVGTIDRHGLKAHFLGKHRRDVDRFYARHVEVADGSAAAGRFRERLARWRPKLFTFLDHDGVPWNNNNAENAVKRFVTRRKAMGGTGALTENGLRDFLVLLSVYQTLRYRGLNFWQFLRSGETDIDRFTGRGRQAPGSSSRPRLLTDPVPRPVDRDLASLIKVWPTLLDPIRAGILAMVRAAGGLGGRHYRPRRKARVDTGGCT
ncbi:MAG TPA: IS66 family transposase [Gemmataceae bacterium]